ncbi:MAG: 1-phosphofructokinase [Subdoligranulum variabile]|nr:1-phosphofructokinase [Subdoligranulum variabile]
MIYTVTFNPAIDYVVRLGNPLQPGAVNRAAGEDCVLGGKGINVSGVLAQLGVESVALGFIAGETGAWLERGLTAQGLHTDFIWLENGMTRINVKIKAGQETELNGAGPNIPESAMQTLETKLDALQKDDVLILAGSIPACLPQSTYERLLARLQGRGVRAVVDATQDLLLKVLPYKPFLIKPNNHELSEIVGHELTTDDEIVAAAAGLQAQGARNVLVSMAGDGALLLDENGAVHRIGCPKGKVVNSVGAGDSMVAGFVAGYLRTGDYRYALRLGTACGSATAFSVGLATKEKINELLETI